MNTVRLRRLAWAAVMAEGFFEATDNRAVADCERGKSLARRRDSRGRAYRTVRDYVVPRVRATQDNGEYYIPATLAPIFWDGPWAGNYSWPLLRRPESADPRAVYNRLDHTRRGHGRNAIPPMFEMSWRTYGRESR